METFEAWLKRTGQNTSNVGAVELAKAAWNGATAQSTNYVCDDDTFPRKVTFANGRIVVVRERIEDPGRFYLGVGRVDGGAALDPEKTK